MDKFIVPQGTEVIVNDEFSARKDLIEVYIPKSVIRIATGAFYNCTNLRIVLFEEGSQLKYIDDSVFQNCHSLETINLPDTIERINAHAFWDCSKLPEEIILPKNLQHIETTAFYNTKFKKVFLPIDCKYQVEDHGFPYAPSFPENCEIKGGKQCNFYSHLKRPLTKIDYSSIQPNDCINDKISYFEQYIVPQGTKEIKNNEFSGRTDIVHIVIPRSVIKIGSSAFYFCSNLKTVTFESGSNMPCIDYFVFQNCSSLEKIVLPDGLQQIKAHSFWACPSLKSIVLPNNIQYIDAAAFYMSGIKEILIPAKCRFQGIGHGFPYEASFPESCKINGGIPDNFYADRPFPVPPINKTKRNHLKELKEQLQEYQCRDYIVPQGTRRIWNNQFFGRIDLINITIPKSIEEIDSGAFYLCTNLKSVFFEKGSQLKQISSYTFQNCLSLEYINIPEGVEQLRSHSFWACPKLSEIELPSTLKKIDCSTFYTTKLHKIVLPQYCEYQGVRHGFPHEMSFPENCNIEGGISCDLYKK